jgi:hypothetical protein
MEHVGYLGHNFRCARASPLATALAPTLFAIAIIVCALNIDSDTVDHKISRQGPTSWITPDCKHCILTQAKLSAINPI